MRDCLKKSWEAFLRMVPKVVFGLTHIHMHTDTHHTHIPAHTRMHTLKTRVLSPHMVALAYNHSTGEVEAGRASIWDHLDL